MPNSIRAEYVDLSTELVPNELKLSGDSLNFVSREDQRVFVEVKSGDTGVSITGSNFNDTLMGGAGNDTLMGGAGNDTLMGGAGDDQIQGALGDDSIVGGAGNDTIRDMGGSNKIDAGDGNDVLTIGAGDVITTGLGKDTINFDLTAKPDSGKLLQIMDFQPGEDQMMISADSATKGALAYDKVTGNLILGGKSVATLGKDLTLGAGDIAYSGSDLAVSTVKSNETKVYRFFDPTRGGHFYTTDEKEKNYVQKNLANYTFEGETYDVLNPVTQTGTEEVYRFFNTSTGVHLYTTSEKERDVIKESLASYQYEGVKFYAYDTQVEGSLPVYRFYEPSLGVHFYTPEEKEKTYVMENLDNYNFEGVAYYAMPQESVI